MLPRVFASSARQGLASGLSSSRIVLSATSPSRWAQPVRTYATELAQEEHGVRITVDSDNYATVTLDDGKGFNTFSDKVIERLSAVWRHLRETKPRAMFLRAEGRFFSAGANLQWMRGTASYTRDENVADAERLSAMLHSLNTLPCPTVALVQGPAFGGGVGLVSCCDVAIGVSTAHFTLSEVKLGLIPATISPYVVNRIGAAQARRYFLTAEQISAERAKEIGLLHEVCQEAEELHAWESQLRSSINLAAPSGVRASKSLVFAVAGKPINDDMLHDTAVRLADQRASEEGQAGLAAFFNREKAPWVKE